MIRRESKFTTLFRHWLKANPMASSAFELKQTTTNSLPFSAVKEHQLTALVAATKPQGILYKAPDDSRGIKPFDLFYLSLAYAWIVIKYPGVFHIIAVETFMLEMKRSKRKSLLQSRAREISTVSVNLNKKTA